MPISALIATVCLIACHGGPADHFATYAEVLTEEGYDVQIHATGPALKKFQERGVEVKCPFSLDHLTTEEEDNLAQAIAETCSTASLVITDLGHVFDVKIQKALSMTKTSHFAYYDNPECFVPGGYSSTAAKVIEIAEGVLFASEALAKDKIYKSIGTEIDFTDKKRFGIGYYPVTEAEKIAEKRKSDRATVRSTFLMENEIEDKGQTILVYFGGNNEEYFLKAFPTFLSFLPQTSEQVDLTNIIIVIQQHPGAKVRNQDGQQVAAWLEEFGGLAKMPKVLLSHFSSDSAQILADAAFYYQTSMSPQFVLAGIPTVQIGHETYKDILYRLIPTVTGPIQLAYVIKNLESGTNETLQKDLILSKLGIRKDWPQILKEIINELVVIPE